MGSLLTIFALETPSMFTSIHAMHSGCLSCGRWHRRCAGSLRNWTWNWKHVVCLLIALC